MKRLFMGLILILTVNSMVKHQAGSQELSVQVDGRIELLGVVELLSGDVPTATDLKFPYRGNVEAWFKPFIEHDAIRMFRGMPQ